MGFFRWLFSAGRASKPAALSDLWNPTGVDRLYDEELHQAIDAFTADGSTENRRCLYEQLLRVNYCIPLNEAQAESEPLIVRAVLNDSGERAMIAFTDPCAMKRYTPNPPSMMILTATKLFELVLKNDFSQLLPSVRLCR
jgi:hypothetical protein